MPDSSMQPNEDVACGEDLSSGHGIAGEDFHSHKEQELHKKQQYAALRILVIAKETRDLTPLELIKLEELEARIGENAARIIDGLKAVLNIAANQDVDHQSLIQQVPSLNKRNLAKFMRILGVSDMHNQTAQVCPEAVPHSYWLRAVGYFFSVSQLFKGIGRSCSTTQIARITMKVSNWFASDLSVSSAARSHFSKTAESMKQILLEVRLLAHAYVLRKSAERKDVESRGLELDSTTKGVSPPYMLEPWWTFYYREKENVEEENRKLLDLAMQTMSRMRDMGAILNLIACLEERIEGKRSDEIVESDCLAQERATINTLLNERDSLRSKLVELKAAA